MNSFGWESTVILPPKISTIMREMQSPSPIPLVFDFIVFFIVAKSLNRFLSSYWVIPTPLSVTSIWTWVFGPVPLLFISWQFIEIWPFLPVNLIAFDRRLSNTCWSRLMSVLIKEVFSSKSLKLESIWICFVWAWSIWIDIISFTAYLRENSWISILSLFNLI